MGGDGTGQLLEIGELLVDRLSGLVDRQADAVEAGPRLAQLSDIGEIEEARTAAHGIRGVRPRGRRPRRPPALLFPSIVRDQQLVQVAVDRPQARQAAQVGGQEAAVGEQVVDERKDEESEVDRQLPGVAQGERLLVSQSVVAHRVARHVGLVDRARHLFEQCHLGRQLLPVRGQDGVGDQRVVDRNEIAARTVKRVAEAAGLAAQRPAGGVQGPGAIVGEVGEARGVEDLAPRQVARQQRVLAANPGDHLLRRRDFRARHPLAVVDQAEAGLAVQRDHPEPVAFAAEVVGGQEDRRVAEGRAVAAQPHLARGEVGQPLQVDQALDPAEGGAMADRARRGQPQALGQHLAAPRRVDHPAGAAGELPAAVVVGTEREQVRLPLPSQLDLQIGHRRRQGEARRLAVEAQQLRFENVPVQLVGEDVRQLAEIGLAQLLVAFATAAILPVEA